MTLARSLRSRVGLTFVELIVVGSIFGSLSAILYSTFRMQGHTMAANTAQNVTQSDLRWWLGRMVKDVRMACYDPLQQGSFQILEATPTELRFALAEDGDGDGVVDGTRHLGYRRNGDRLELWSGGTSWRPILAGVQDLTFTYRDAQGTRTERCSSIALVEIELAAEGSAARSPGSSAPVIRQNATVEMRNAVRCS